MGGERKMEDLAGRSRKRLMFTWMKMTQEPPHRERGARGGERGRIFHTLYI
jgi:hypothetical protein